MFLCIKYCRNILYPCSPCHSWFIPIFPFMFMGFVKSFPGHRFWLVRMASGTKSKTAADLCRRPFIFPQKKCFSPSCEGNDCQARERRRRRTITVVRPMANIAHVEGSGMALNVSVPSSSTVPC